jgi:hypothetical protein
LDLVGRVHTRRPGRGGRSDRVPGRWTWDAEPGTLEGEAISELQAAISARVSSEQQAEARTITALVVLREKVLKPLLAAASHPTASTPLRPKLGRKPKTWSPIDDHYQTLRLTMHALLNDLRLAAA